MRYGITLKEEEPTTGWSTDHGPHKESRSFAPWKMFPVHRTQSACRARALSQTLMPCTRVRWWTPWALNLMRNMSSSPALECPSRRELCVQPATQALPSASTCGHQIDNHLPNCDVTKRLSYLKRKQLSSDKVLQKKIFILVSWQPCTKKESQVWRYKVVLHWMPLVSGHASHLIDLLQRRRRQ